jgi:hypothetical protein
MVRRLTLAGIATFGVLLCLVVLYGTRYQTVSLSGTTAFYRINRWTGETLLVRPSGVYKIVEVRKPTAPVKPVASSTAKPGLFEEVAAKVTDSTQRVKFKKAVWEEAVRTGKTVDEVTASMMQ